MTFLQHWSYFDTWFTFKLDFICHLTFFDKRLTLTLNLLWQWTYFDIWLTIKLHGLTTYSDAWFDTGIKFKKWLTFNWHLTYFDSGLTLILDFKEWPACSLTVKEVDLFMVRKSLQTPSHRKQWSPKFEGNWIKITDIQWMN